MPFVALFVFLGALFAVAVVFARLAILGVLFYYFFFDPEPLLAWASKWWQALVAAAGLLYIASGIGFSINTKD